MPWHITNPVQVLSTHNYEYWRSWMAFNKKVGYSEIWIISWLHESFPCAIKKDAWRKRYSKHKMSCLPSFQTKLGTEEYIPLLNSLILTYWHIMWHRFSYFKYWGPHCAKLHPGMTSSRARCWCCLGLQNNKSAVSWEGCLGGAMIFYPIAWQTRAWMSAVHSPVGVQRKGCVRSGQF